MTETGTRADPAIVASTPERVATCIVCGGEILTGQGITALFEGRRLRFKCEDCFEWFMEDPHRFLAGHVGRCCGDDCSTSAGSEWTYG